MLAENLGAFVIAAFALTGSPGPATLGRVLPPRHSGCGAASC